MAGRDRSSDERQSLSGREATDAGSVSYGVNTWTEREIEFGLTMSKQGDTLHLQAACPPGWKPVSLVLARFDLAKRRTPFVDPRFQLPKLPSRLPTLEDPGGDADAPEHMWGQQRAGRPAVLWLLTQPAAARRRLPQARTTSGSSGPGTTSETGRQTCSFRARFRRAAIATW